MANMGGTHCIQYNKVNKLIWKLAISRNIWLNGCHLPGKNICADRLSRAFKDNVEWQLCPKIFRAISMLWGEPQIDLFASHANKQLATFVSWKPHQDVLHLDAFSFNLKEYYFYAFPPFALISVVLQK